jgi:hypothetical protein
MLEQQTLLEQALLDQALLEQVLLKQVMLKQVLIKQVRRVLLDTWNGRLSHDFFDEVEHFRMIDPDVDSGQLVVAALADSAGYEAHLWPALQNLWRGQSFFSPPFSPGPERELDSNQ